MVASPEALSRRRFAVTALSASAALFSSHRLSAQGIGTVPGESVDTDTPAPKRGTNTSYAPLKQIDAGLLNVGYAEAGPADGPAVILLHGWPYDIYSFVDVAPLLAAKGYRVIVPYLRGFGTTRFRSGETVRNGQQSVVALDTIALMDALKINKATITLEGDANGAPHLDAGAYANKFSGKYAHRIITGGVGHNLPQEAPADFAQAIVDVDGY
jgi:pimeloyl-ACP methyl ester carboxylesterase